MPVAEIRHRLRIVDPDMTMQGFYDESVEYLRAQTGLWHGPRRSLRSPTGHACVLGARLPESTWNLMLAMYGAQARKGGIGSSWLSGHMRALLAPPGPDGFDLALALQCIHDTPQHRCRRLGLSNTGERAVWWVADRHGLVYTPSPSNDFDPRPYPRDSTPAPIQGIEGAGAIQQDRGAGPSNEIEGAHPIQGIEAGGPVQDDRDPALV